MPHTFQGFNLGSGLQIPHHIIGLTRQFYALTTEPQTQRRSSRLYLPRKSSPVSCHGLGTLSGFRVFKWQWPVQTNRHRFDCISGPDHGPD